MKSFKEELKREMKKLKHDVEKVPKDQRKEVLRRRKEETEIDHAERVRTCFSVLLLVRDAQKFDIVYFVPRRSGSSARLSQRVWKPRCSRFPTRTEVASRNSSESSFKKSSNSCEVRQRYTH